MLIKYDKADVLRKKNDFGVGQVEQIKMIIIQSYNSETAALAFSDLEVNGSKQAAHYAVDATDVIKYAPSSTNLISNDVLFLPLGRSLLPPKETTDMFETENLNSFAIRTKLKDLVDQNTSVVKKALDDDYKGNYINIVEVCWGDKSNYQAIANNLIKFLAQQIRDHGFKLENIWRAGDIIDYEGKEPELDQRNPYQYTHLKDWHSLLDAVAYCVDHPDSEPPANTFCFELDDHINVKRHCPLAVCVPEHSHSGHIHHWEPDDRGITKLTNFVDVKKDSIVNEDYENKTLNGSSFQQSRFQPDTIQNSVAMESNYYEPIYPDLTCPPRSCTGLYNIGIIKIKQILDKLTAAEQKKQQDIMNLEKNTSGEISQVLTNKSSKKMPKAIDHTNESDMLLGEDLQDEVADTISTVERERLKPVLGKIPNLFDPYPVDDKIAQLEFHAPMVTLEYQTSQDVQDNLTFYTINRFINTEKRLVQLENIMATQMRLLNRLSSRIKINCIYYGGTSVYDKYRCIRCLCDDLTNDAAIVTLDQCLNCSRYEPIEGQVYEIMNEDLSPGEANIYDDIQASYMTKDDFIEFSCIEEMNIEDEEPSIDLTKTNERDKTDKDYSTLLKEANNFVMNWQRKPWDYQSPHINEYVYDFAKIVLDKEERLKDINKYEDGWRSIAQKKFERPDYGVNVLGDGINSNGFVFNGSNTVPLYHTLNDYDINPNDIRFKLVEYAKQAAEICKATQQWQYTLGAKIKDELKTKTPKELAELATTEEVCTYLYEKQGNNTVYTDCSNFCHYIYYCASNGSLNIPGTVSSIYSSQEFNRINEGKEVLEAIKDAIPGDLIVYKGVGSAHVVMYIGNDECAEAYGDCSDKTKEVSVNKLTNRKDFVGIFRHKSLSVPKLKNLQYVEVTETLGNWVKNHQCDANKNTKDSKDKNWTREPSFIAKYVAHTPLPQSHRRTNPESDYQTPSAPVPESRQR